MGELGQIPPEFVGIVHPMIFFWQFFWQTTPFWTFRGKLPLILNGLIVGSRGRTRTFNHTVNSRVLYH